MRITAAEAFVTLRPDLSHFKSDTESGLSNIPGLAKAAAVGISFATVAIAGLAGVAIRAAVDEQAGIERLAQAVRANGGDWEKLGSTIEGQIGKWERLTAFSDSEMRDALSSLTAITGDATEAMDRLPIAMDFARGAGIDLSTASRLLGKVTDETTSVLGRYGIRVEKGADATEVLRLVQQKFAGQSAAFAKTAAGQWRIFTNQVDNLKEELGTALLPAFTGFAGLAIRAVDAVRLKFEELRPTIGAIITTITGAFTSVWNAAPVQFFVGTILTELRKVPGFVAQVAGSIGEMFEVLSGTGRPEAGGVLRSLVGDNLAVNIQTTLKNVRVVFTQAFDFLKPIVQGVIDKVVELKQRFDDLPPAIKAFAATAVVAKATGIDDLFLNIANTAATVASGVYDTANAARLLGPRMATAAAAMWAFFAGETAVGTISLPVSIGLWSIVAPLIAGAAAGIALAAIGIALGVALGALIIDLGGVRTAIGNLIGRGFDALGTAVHDVLLPFIQLKDLFARDFPFALGLLLGAIVSTFGAAQEAVGTALTAIFDTFGSFLNLLGGWKTDLGNLIGQAVQGMLDGLGDFAGQAIPKVVKFVIDAASEIARLKDRFFEAAADAVKGFVRGLIDGFPNAIAEIIKGAAGFLAGFNLALGNHSPSTKFAEAGLNITRGLVLGLNRGKDDVANALAGLTGPSDLIALPAAGSGEQTLVVDFRISDPNHDLSALSTEAIRAGTMDAMTQVFRQARVQIRGLS